MFNMPKIGDILWTFHGNTYSVGEISDLSIVNIGELQYYFISTNGIIGSNQKMFVPATEDFNTLVEIHYRLLTVYYTISESVAINYIREHYNETDN